MKTVTRALALVLALTLTAGCAVSWGEDAAGNRYICATGDAGSSWQAIYDHAALYKLCSGEPADTGGDDAAQTAYTAG